MFLQANIWVSTSQKKLWSFSNESENVAMQQYSELVNNVLSLENIQGKINLDAGLESNWMPTPKNNKLLQT